MTIDHFFCLNSNVFWRNSENHNSFPQQTSPSCGRHSLWTTVDLLQLWTEVGLRGFQRPGGQQVPLLQQVDGPQGLQLQLGNAAEAPQCRRQLRQVGECLQRGDKTQNFIFLFIIISTSTIHFAIHLSLNASFI